jgi:hypothetical protein
MANVVKKIPLSQLTPHPDNPNRMSKTTFAKLVRNIERTSRYEPLIVREIRSRKSEDRSQRSEDPASPKGLRRAGRGQKSGFQIINGHHRWLALKELGEKEADVIIWDVDDGEADILLATLNRLGGQDVLDKKLALLKRLSDKMKTSELAKLLPQTKKQIEKLNSILDTRLPMLDGNRGSKISSIPFVFFVSEEQQQTIEAALDSAMQDNEPAHSKPPVMVPARRVPKLGAKYLACRFTAGSEPKIQRTKAERRAEALSAICKYYIDKRTMNEGIKKDK